MERTTFPKKKGENQNKSATRKLRTAAGLRKSFPLDSTTYVPERPCVRRTKIGKPKSESQKLENQYRKTEIGKPKSENRNRKTEIGKPKSEN